MPTEVEVADDVFIITKEAAEKHLAAQAQENRAPDEANVPPTPTVENAPHVVRSGPAPAEAPSSNETTADPAGFTWTALVPYQKWSNLYMKVLSKFAAPGALTIHVSVNVRPKEGVSMSRIDELKVALRELSLAEDVKVEKD